MALMSHAVGPNSYCINTTQGTTTDMILQEIIRIVALKDRAGDPLHGWELVRVDYDKPFVSIRMNVVFQQVAWFRSPYTSGGYKYAAICVISDSRMTIMMANSVTEDLSSLITIESHSIATSRGSYTYAMGTISHDITIETNDRLDFMLFISPRWLAFTCVAYSSKEQTNSGRSSYGSYTAFGVIGVFELYGNLPSRKMALVNTAMAIEGEPNTTYNYESIFRVYFPNGIAVDKPGRYPSGVSGVKVCNAGELTSSNSATYGGLSRCSSNLSANMVSMLDLYDSSPSANTNSTSAAFTDMRKLGSLHGLKSIARNANQKPFSKLYVRSDEDGKLKGDGPERLHLVIPCYVEGVGGEESYRTRYATVLLPA